MPGVSLTDHLSLRIQLLAGFRVFIGSCSVDESAWRLRKARSLVKLLALAPGHRLHRRRVLDLLWPDLAPEAAANNLHRALYAARRVLEPQRAVGEPAAHLQVRDDAIILCPSGQLWIDVEAFEAACVAARQVREPGAYQAALALYSGDLLPEDRYEDWAVRKREELRVRYMATLREAAEVYETQGDISAAIEMFNRLVATDPIREDAHIALMRLHALSGQRYQALRQFQQLRETLRRELDVEPDARTLRLHEEILRGTFTPRASASPASVIRTHGSEASSFLDRAPGTPQNPPAGSTASAAAPRRTNLTAYLTSFVGREVVMKELMGLLATARLLTVVGAGGCGKTRLAMEMASTQVGTYRDGVWAVDLAALAEPQLVSQAVASVLGLREEAGRPLVGRLAEGIRHRQVLLVLDNCEHLRDACAQLADELLASCPDLRILATSRQPLGLEEEVVWHLPTLDVPDFEHLPPFEKLSGYGSIQLFVERAAANRPGFDLTPQNAAAVVRICQRLDGIPLAIELAAGRVRLLTAEQIADRIDDGFLLLSGGSRVAPPHHQTLRAALDWSHDLLSEAERTLFRRLSVFAGGWSRAAAEDICAGEGIRHSAVRHLLAQLVERSLVVAEYRPGGERYRLLETTRQYSAEKLVAAGEADPRCRRHAGWYLALVEETESHLSGPEQKRGLELIDAEHDNLRAALAWAREHAAINLGLRIVGAMHWYWYNYGHPTEGLRWLVEMLNVEHGGGRRADGPVRAKALKGGGVLAWMRGEYGRAMTLCAESANEYRQFGDEANVARALHNLGLAARDAGDWERAARVLEECLATGRRLNDRVLMASTLHNVGSVARDQLDAERAERACVEGLSLWQELGNKQGMASTLHNLGMVAQLRGDLEQAAQQYAESIVLFEELGVAWGIAECLEGFGRVSVARNQSALAARLFGAADTLRKNSASPLAPAERVAYERAVATARSALGDQRFEAAWSMGEAMPLDVVVRDALLLNAKPRRARNGSPARSNVLASLTAREREISALIAAGLTNREIAAKFSMSIRTADTHVGNILAKLHLGRREEVAAWVQAQQDAVTHN